MNSIDTYPVESPASEQAIETGERRKRFPSQAARLRFYYAVIGALIVPAAYGMGLQKGENSQVAAYEPPEPRSVSIFMSPPDSLRVPEKVGTIAAKVEIICAHYIFERFPSRGDTVGYKPTDYHVFDKGTQASGFAMAVDVVPAGPVPPCNDSEQFRNELEDSIPGIINAESPVHGNVAE